MSTWNQAYRTQCQLFFTNEGLQKNFPGSTEAPWTLLSEWGPTPKYGLSGFNAVIPEMNKVVAVFSDVYGFERFNATSVPFLGIGCDGNCTVHAGAYEAYLEARNATNNWQDVRDHLGQHIWSSAGAGFGGMVMQIAALETSVNRINGRGFEAAHSFGSPPVFNAAAVQIYNSRIQGEGSVRTVANRDSWPRFIPQSEDFRFVNTAMSVYNESNPTFYQSYLHCDSPDDARCHGGDVPEDHFFYYTQAGTCAENFEVQRYNWTAQSAFLARLRTEDAARNPSSPLPSAPVISQSSVAPASSAPASQTATEQGSPFSRPEGAAAYTSAPSALALFGLGLAFLA